MVVVRRGGRDVAGPELEIGHFDSRCGEGGSHGVTLGGAHECREGGRVVAVCEGRQSKRASAKKRDRHLRRLRCPYQVAEI